ncbi:helix-turn-helix domain-containing protein [Arthrobacter sp. UNC362MFTsu5.1]|uniref:helix-turn-helix domain-containing protein n=1 Tax=Arthrobacter sp. UNC362MFTsu5.1 TaxID=1449044 RepID=UPI000483EE7E|nr:cupin domain-containing protein [Arthrobacter sp. UNC362MFTsu5.1]
MEKTSQVNLDHDELEVGSRIRELRLEKKFSLRELGARLGISASALSQIETGKRRPSVARLHQIVSILDAPLSAVFGETTGNTFGTSVELPEGAVVQRQNEASELILEGGVEWLRLSPTPIPGIDLLKVTYPPGGGWDEYLRHNGHETAHVLTGTLNFDVGFEHHTLAAGDSISYSSTSPHRIKNPGTEVAVAIWLVLNTSTAV